MDAIILAGEDKDDIKYFGQGKALVHFNNKPLIQHTIDVLDESGLIDYILVVGNKKALTPIIGNKVDKIIDQENDMLDNLIKGMSYFQEDENVMVATCDTPLLTISSIYHLVAKSFGLGADICYPIIERSVCESKYPDVKRTYASLKDGDFTGGNLMMINPKKIEAIQEHIRPLIKYRKNPLKMTKVLGPSIVMQMISKKLTIEKLESYIKERFNIKGKAIISPYPEIASDIDHVEDIKILEKYI